jgi:RNA polymerase sigma-70 factor (ECF subfamily)
MPSENISQEFVAFVDSHRKLIYKVCRIYCRDNNQVKDVEQEILAQLWTAFPKYDHTCRPGTWIYRIALNTAISYYRREKKHRVNRVDVDRTIFQLAAGEDNSELEEQIGRLYRVIDGFAELDRALLLLYLDDNPYGEMAKVLGITVTNVATKISRLKQRLRILMIDKV